MDLRVELQSTEIWSLLLQMVTTYTGKYLIYPYPAVVNTEQKIKVGIYSQTFFHRKVTYKKWKQSELKPNNIGL